MFRNLLIVLSLLALVLAAAVILIPGKGTNMDKIVEGYDGCSSSVSFYIENGETCSVTTTVVTKNCNNAAYEIKNGESICTGNIDSNDDNFECTWHTEQGTHSYNLYINGQSKESIDFVCAGQLEQEPVCQA